MTDEMHDLLAALVEQSRATAIRMAGDPDRETTCHFCGGNLPLWESLLMMQLSGVSAHAECPADILDARLRKVGPDPTFPYSEFSQSVESRMQQTRPDSCSGEIDAPAGDI